MQPKNVNIAFQITKVDEEQRRVYGVATSEALDSQGDVIDYEASKKAVADWMKVGNIREMHDAGKAVGKAFDAQFDDANKHITVGAYISRSADGENTWIKVKEGVLTGYSVGGSVHKSEVQKSDDGAAVNRITDWSMSELSLVDNPANPTAQIVMVKSKDSKSLDYIDIEELRKAITKRVDKHLGKETLGLPVAWWVQKYQDPDELSEAKRDYEVTQMARIAKKDYSDKQRAAMADKGQALPDGSFPIANKSDLANAIKAYGRAKDKAKAKEHIITRAKALGAVSMLPANWNAKAATGDLTKREQADKLIKDFFGVATIVDAALSLQFFQQCELDEGDEATANAVQEALTALKTAAESELAELEPEEVLVMANAISAGQKAADLAKAKKAKLAKGGEAVVDSDPRDATGATVAPTVPKPASGGTVVPKNVVQRDGKTVTVVNKLKDAGFDAEQILKIIAATELPEAAQRVTNPSAGADQSDNGKKDGDEDADDEVDAPTEHANDGSDGGEPNGGGAPTDPKTAEPAAATSDTPRDLPNNDPGTSDSPSSANPDAPTPAADDERSTNGNNAIDDPTDDGDDEDDDENADKSAIATLQKSVSELTGKLNALTGESEIAKSIAGVGELVKKVAEQQSDLDQRLRRIEKQPAPAAQPKSAAFPAHEVVKGEEHLVADTPVGDRSGLSKSEIVSLLKQAKEYEAHPNMGSEQERGEVFRKLWKVKDLAQYEKYLN